VVKGQTIKTNLSKSKLDKLDESGRHQHEL